MNEESHQVINSKLNDVVGQSIPNIFTTGIQVAKEHVKPSNSHGINSTSVNYTNASNDVVDMCHFIQTDVIVTYTPATADENWTVEKDILYKACYDRVILKRFPLNQSMNSLDASINDNSITIRPYQLIPLSDYQMNETREKYFSSPSQRDMYGSYAASVGTARNNPFNALCDIEHASSFSRSAFPRKITVDDIGKLNKVEITFTLVEPLFLHPYFAASHENKCYGRVENLNLDINWRDLKTMFCNLDTISDGGGTPKVLNFSSIAFGPKLNLLYRTYTPNVSIEPVISNKFEHRYIIQRTLTVAKGTPQTLNIDQTTLSTIPENIYLYAIAHGGQDTGKSVESMLTITNVSFRLDLDSSALGTSTEEQLFEMAKRNGYIGDWNSYSNYNGCALKISIPNGDIGGYIANANRPFIFSAQVTFENNTYTDVVIKNNVAETDYDIFMVCESQGHLILSPGSGSKIVGYSEASLMDAMQKVPLDYDSHDIFDHSGGSWKGFKRFIGKAIKAAPKALRVGSNLLNATGNPEAMAASKTMGSIASAFGAGYGQGAHGGSLVVAGNGQGMLLNQTHNVSKVRRTTKKRL